MCADKVCGVSGVGSSLPLPGDPGNAAALTATSVYGGIELVWVMPETNPHAVAYTVVYRSTLSSADDAVQHALVSGDRFFDPSPDYAPVRFFYWIQPVSIHGTRLQILGPADAVARPKYQDILEEVSGEINRGVLGQALQTKIDEIDTISQRIYAESVDRIANDETLGEAFNLLQDDIEGTLTVIEEETRIRADNDSALIEAMNLIQVGVDSTQAALMTEEQVRADGDSALASRIDAFVSQTDDNLAAIQSTQETFTNTLGSHALSLSTLFSESEESRAALRRESQVRTDSDAALGSRIDSMAVEIGKTNSSILDESLVRAEADKALAKDVSALFAVTEHTDAMLVNEAETRAAQDSALASAVQSVVARLDAQPIWVSSFEAGSDFDRWKTKTGGSISAISDGYQGQAGLLTHSGVNPSSSGSPGTVWTSISSSLALNFSGKRIRVTGYAKRPATNAANEFAVAYSSAREGNSGWQRFTPTESWTLFEFLWDVPEDNDTGEDYLGFWADTSNSGKGVLIDLINIQPATSEEDLPVITAAIQTESEARVAADEALASRINTVQLEYGNNFAAVEERLEVGMETINGVLKEMGALYTVKVQSNGLIGGYGIYNDGTQIEAGFDVDRFWVGKQSQGGKYYPFIIEDNNILFNGRVQFSNVSGAGSLAGKNSLTYNEIQGTKPPSNADKTSSNTARDTSRVNGVAASTVRARADRGHQAKTRTDDWTRSGTTLIDGNKLYTRDAFIVNAMIRNAAVDTLQIKGQAVTIPTATSAGSLITTSAVQGNPYRILSMAVHAQGNPIMVTATAAIMLPGSVNSASYGRRNYHVRLARVSHSTGQVAHRGSVYAGLFLRFKSYMATMGFGAAVISVRDHPPAGWWTYYIEVWQQAPQGTFPLEIRNRSITALEVKR